MSDKTTEAEIRAHVRAAIQEQLKENSATNKPTESKQLSEVRTHIRRAINEIMVGLTPITRIDNANDANSGVDTPSAVVGADIGFNTFNMQEWASIAGIVEEPLNEALSDDTGDDTMLGGNDSDFEDNLVPFPKPDYLSSDMPGQDRMEPTRQAVSDSRGDEDVFDMEDEVEDLVAQLLADRDNEGVANLADYDDADYDDDYEDDDYNEDRFRLSDADYDDEEDDSKVFDFSKF